jgi:hypothetical protein
MRFFACLGIAVLGGCAPVPIRTYVPVGVESTPFLGRACQTNHRITLPELNGVKLSLILAERIDVLSGSLQVDVAAGTTLRFGRADLLISESRTKPPAAVKLVGGRYPASESISGFALSEYTWVLPMPASLPEEIGIELPAMEINGLKIRPHQINLKLTRRISIILPCQ